MNANLAAAVAWLRQPTSIAGISAMAGTLTAVAAGDMTWPVAAPLLVGGLIALAVPEMPKAASDGGRLTADVLAAAASRNPAAVAVALGDAVQVASDLAPVVTVAMSLPVTPPTEEGATALAVAATVARVAVPALALMLMVGACTPAERATAASDVSTAASGARTACLLNGTVVAVDPRVAAREGASVGEVCAIVRAVPAT